MTRTRKMLIAASVVATSFAGGAIGNLLMTGSAQAQSTAATPAPSTAAAPSSTAAATGPGSPGFKGNEDPAHEATESPEREAAEENGTAWQNMPARPAR
jgi:hypothetical protein